MNFEILKAALYTNHEQGKSKKKKLHYELHLRNWNDKKNQIFNPIVLHNKFNF